LTFIINAVFLRFYNRNYKDMAEKWIVAEKALKVLNLYIKSYEVSPHDFPATSGQFEKEENSPPGFHVMLQLHTKSEFLRLILHIIDEAVTLFDSYTQFPGKKYLERTVYYCLNLIERTLAQQDVFFDAHFNANCSILLSGLNKLLLGVNPRSGKPDHMLNITKFVTYNSWLPCHALSAIKILKMVTRQPNVNPQILGLFTQTEKVKLEIRQGFVECLENELLTGNLGEIDIMLDADHYSIEVEDNLSEDIELNIKESVILLIQECLPQATPNVAHYLLGFDTTKDIRSARPGFMDFPRSCLKSLLTILDGGLEDSKHGKVVSARQERLVDSAYALLYTLCYNLQISELILR
jgi:nuclear pore complex protein Nup205